MKLPKEIKTYCRKCNKHTAHSLKEYKASKASSLSRGTRKHLRVTKHGYGGKHKYITLVRKKNKRPTYIATCKVCGKKHYFVIDTRQKKPELIAAND
jgi:large subunit ribosomal protein L44e